MRVRRENGRIIAVVVKENGKERSFPVEAIGYSCFFKYAKLMLFADGAIWSNIRLVNTESGERDIYLTREGLKKKIELPHEIISSFKEALGCYLDGYYSASVVLSRKLLEGVLITKGASPKQRISDMIKELVKRGILDEKLQSLSDQIKYLGNIGAHIKEEDVNKSDVEQALHFCDFLVTWLFGKVEMVSK